MIPVALAVACMALLSPDVLVCQTKAGVSIVCQVDPPRCETPEHLYRGFRGHRERQATFVRKLYGVK
jgi:hypothetical protein